MPKLYGSVNGGTKEIIKLYGGVREYSYTYDITGFTGIPTVSFVAKTFNDKYQATYGAMTAKPLALRALEGGGNTYVWLYLAGGTHKNLFNYPTNSYSGQGQAWGFVGAYHPIAGDFHAEWIVTSTSYTDTAKKITKLYGSVNGETKLIYEDTNA